MPAVSPLPPAPARPGASGAGSSRMCDGPAPDVVGPPRDRLAGPGRPVGRPAASCCARGAPIRPPQRDLARDRLACATDPRQIPGDA